MLNFKEVLEKTVDQRKQIEETMNKKAYHPEDANLYDGLKQSDAYEVKLTLDSMSLAEVLVRAYTTDAALAYYLVPTKVHDTLYHWARQYDICPLIGYVTDKWEGGDLDVPIPVDGSYTPRQMSSTGRVLDEETKFATKATLSPETYGVNLNIGNDLIEDQEFGLVEWHVQQAAKAIGEQASDLALVILTTAPDGDGNLNSGAAAAASTLLSNILSALKGNASDRFVSNTMVCTQEAWADALIYGVVVAGANYWIPPGVIQGSPSPIGYPAKYVGILDTLINNSPKLHASTDVEGAAFTACKTVVFDRNNSILTGRKRWLELKNYSDPISGLVGATVSYRQDSVSLYKDAIYVLTEA